LYLSQLIRRELSEIHQKKILASAKVVLAEAGMDSGQA
jgi:hypothetical protein